MNEPKKPILLVFKNGGSKSLNSSTGSERAKESNEVYKGSLCCTTESEDHQKVTARR